jgi:hypothetical protein
MCSSLLSLHLLYTIADIAVDWMPGQKQKQTTKKNPIKKQTNEKQTIIESLLLFGIIYYHHHLITHTKVECLGKSLMVYWKI